MSFEQTGTANVQRFAGQFAETIVGAGLGDIDHDGNYSSSDINLFAALLQSSNTQFDAAGDLDGDGRIDGADLTLLGDRLDDVNADGETQQAYDDLVAQLSDPLQVESITPTPSGVTVVFSEAIDSSVLNLYDGDDAAIDAADALLTDNAGSPVAGSLVLEADSRTLHFIPTGGPLPAGDYTFTLRGRTEGIVSSAGVPLDGNEDGAAGGDFVSSVPVFREADVVVLSLPDFSRGPGQPVELQGTTGIPLSVLSLGGVTEIDFVLHFDNGSLNITGYDLTEQLPDGWTKDIEDVATPGQIRVKLSGDTPLPAGELSLVVFAANVVAAERGGARRLWIDSAAANEGTRFVDADMAVHSNSYVGDASGNGEYSAFDASQIARVAVGLQNGFEFFGMIDPVIIGDATGNKSLSALDASYVARRAVGLAQPEIPEIPTPMPAPVAGIRGFTADASLLWGLTAASVQPPPPMPIERENELESADLRSAADVERGQRFADDYFIADEELLARAKHLAAGNAAEQAEFDADEVESAESWEAVFSEIGASDR